MSSEPSSQSPPLVAQNHAALEAGFEIERYRAVLETQTEMVCRFRPDGTILFVNGAYARSRGVSAAGMLNRNFWEFVPEEDRPAVRLTLSRLTPENPEIQIENRFATLDGLRWVLWINRALRFDADGTLAEAQSTGIDITERRRAEEALRESEQRFQAFFDNSATVVYIKDLDGCYVQANSRFQHLCGLAPEQVRGKTDFDLFPGHTAESFRESDLTVIRTGRSVEIEEVAPHPDGPRSYIWIKFPLRRADGTVYAIGGIATDITQRKRDDEAARRLAAIVGSSDDAIVGKDLNGIITSWNKAAERIFGYAAEEIIGRPVTTLIPEERQQEEQVILSRIRHGERVDHFETIRRRKDGTLLEISLTTSPIRDEHGRIIGASKIARDVTERKRIERQQQALYELVATINRTKDVSAVFPCALDAICRCQDASRAAILVHDAKGVMRFSAWHGISERYRHAVEGHSPWDANRLDQQPVCVDDVAQLELDEPVREAVRLEGICAMAFIPLVHERRLIGKLMVYYDVPHRFTLSEIRPSETIARQVVFAIERQRSGDALERLVSERTASLREAVAQMEEFSYSVSHDLRAPVRAMQGYARVLLEDFGANLDPVARTYLERILNGGSRMERLIHDVLTYSRVSRRDMKLQAVPLDSLVEAVISQYPELDARRSCIHVQPNLPAVLAHEASLGQAVANLLNNALKFVAPGITPRVLVTAQLAPGTVTLRVADNGIGIKPEHQRRLFGMFERIHPEGQYEGTGIGLAIVRKTVERMGGRVGMESDGECGSSFWIELPDARRMAIDE